MKKEIVVLGADHAGYKFKEKLKKYFNSQKIFYEDYGAFELNLNDDYPDFAFRVARRVSEGGAKGILICGSGAGMAISANKVNGVRAIESFDSDSAKLSRKHNNSNVLCLGARNMKFDKVKGIVNVWLKTNFSKKERHLRRIKKISNYEK